MLVLASASPRRRELLTELGVPFRVRAASVDETPPPRAAPDAAAREIALRKALAVLAAAPGATVLAADTIVVAADGEFLAKPADAADARRMLGKLSGTTHRVVTGVCLARAGTDPQTASDTTSVTMRPLSRAEIDAYVASGECFDKAGAYAIQETADRFVTRVDGSRTNVVGLPMETVVRMLRAAGIETRAWA
jgi:nucleoside triphosphate pyrophosphatase